MRDWHDARCLIRHALIRSDPHCAYCGRDLTVWNATLDHVRPKSLGGQLVGDNVRLSCEPCNARKAARPARSMVCSRYRGAGMIPLDRLEVFAWRVGQIATVEPVGFNHRLLDADVRQRVRRITDSINGRINGSVSDVVAIGRLLNEAAGLLPGNLFPVWVRGEFRWKPSVTTRFRNAAHRFGQVECLHRFEPRAVLRLAWRSVPSSAVQEAISRARRGETITLALARSLIFEHRKRPAPVLPPRRMQTVGGLLLLVWLSVESRLVRLSHTLRGLVESVRRRQPSVPGPQDDGSQSTAEGPAHSSTGENVSMAKKNKEFDYSTIDADQRRPVREHAQVIRGHLQSSSYAVVDIGKRLHAVRDLLGAPAFQTWIRDEFRWSQPVASNFMCVASKFGELDCLEQFQPSALYALARQKVPPPAVKAALRMARSGQVVSYTVAHELIAKYQPKTDAAADESTSVEAVEPIEPMTAFRSSLDAFTTTIEQQAALFSTDDVRGLADTLLDLALRLKTWEAPTKRRTASPRRSVKKRNTKAVRSRSAKPAAAKSSAGKTAATKKPGRSNPRQSVAEPRSRKSANDDSARLAEPPVEPAAPPVGERVTA